MSLTAFNTLMRLVHRCVHVQGLQQWPPLRHITGVGGVPLCPPPGDSRPRSGRHHPQGLPQSADVGRPQAMRCHGDHRQHAHLSTRFLSRMEELLRPQVGVTMCGIDIFTVPIKKLLCRPERVRLGTDMVLHPGFSLASAGSSHPLLRRQKSRLTKVQHTFYVRRSDGLDPWFHCLAIDCLYISHVFCSTSNVYVNLVVCRILLV